MTAQAISSSREKSLLSHRTAMRFIVLLGVVSLFGDMTYEGARSVTGPYLGVLGASATIVGIVSGFGELIGYALRLFSGWIGDRTQRYWTVTIAGYALNLFSVPLLALTSTWPAAAALMVAERSGKGLRSPPRDAMLSHAASGPGLGWGFGLHEAMDQAGAMAGPLLVSAVLLFGGMYTKAFAILLAPALVSMTLVVYARYLFPRPRDFDIALPAFSGRHFRRPFWILTAAAALIGAGYADFPLIAYHFGRAEIMSVPVIPILYAGAMATEAISALLLGRHFDRMGPPVLAVSAVVSACAAPLVFLGSFWLAVLGMIGWGVGTGAQESVMRAVVARTTSAERRSTAFGIFTAVFGAAWFLGSVLLGIVYDQSVTAVALLSMGPQLASLPLMIALIASWRRR